VLIKRRIRHHARRVAERRRVPCQRGQSQSRFGLRGMKTNLGDPHRNFVDFSHVPAVKRLTRMPVCVDPQPFGGLAHGPAPTASWMFMHVTAQGVLVGANMVLVGFSSQHSGQSAGGRTGRRYGWNELPHFLADSSDAVEAFVSVPTGCARRYRNTPSPEPRPGGGFVLDRALPSTAAPA